MGKSISDDLCFIYNHVGPERACLGLCLTCLALDLEGAGVLHAMVLPIRRTNTATFDVLLLEDVLGVGG